MYKKLLSLIVVMVMLMSCTVIGLALESNQSSTFVSGVIQPFYTHIASITANLKTEKGLAQCYGKVTTLTEDKVTVVVELQKLNNGSWSKVASWSGSGSGIIGANVAESYPITSGNTYRVKVTGKVVDAKGKILESEIKYSNQKIY